MKLFNKMQDPVILKESDTLSKQLYVLEEYLKTAPEDIKAVVEKDINFLKYGIQGENNILYELKNSHLPVCVLHDLYFEVDNSQAQIDFLVITNKIVFVLECKNLYGNIEVNEQGDFVRTQQFGKRYQKECIYSPVTQNEHHMEVIKKMLLTKKSNRITKALFIKNFDKNYKSVVVLANPKTYLNVRYAPQDIKNQVIRYDQLIRFIKEENSKSARENYSESEMKDLAEYFAGEHKVRDADYIRNYHYLSKERKEEPAIDYEELRQELKEYRLKKSREEKIKPYYIYNNQQMEEIIEIMPHSIEALMKVNGIAQKKCDRYGQDILNIINKYKVVCAMDK